MFKKTAIAASIGIAMSAAAVAQQTPIVEDKKEGYVTSDKYVDTYRWEVDGSYTAGEWSANGFSDTETDAFEVSGTFYIKPVDVTEGPRGESAFIDHASDVTAFYSYSEVDDNGIDIDGDSYGLSGRWVTDGGFIFEGALSRYEPLDGEVDTFRLSAGYYITDVTTLIIDYRDADADEGGDTDGWNGRIEHLFGFGDNAGVKLNANYGFINVDDADDIDLWGVSAIWYITHDIGIGVGYENTDFGILESEDYYVGAEWFITRNIAVNLTYEHKEPDDLDNDFPGAGALQDLDLEYDAITLGGTIRF